MIWNLISKSGGALGYRWMAWKHRAIFEVADARFSENMHQIFRQFCKGFGNSKAPIPTEYTGFWAEGLAASAALLDQILKTRSVFKVISNYHEQRYTCYVGTGWAFGYFGGTLDSTLLNDASLLRWLAFDGAGFRDAMLFKRVLSIMCRPDYLPTGYAGRAWDQGVGRWSWFQFAGDAKRIGGFIASQDAARRSDLWSGVGLAATYAGKVERSKLVSLADISAVSFPALAQGVCFGAKARLAAGFVPEHTRLACEVMLSRDVGSAAKVTDDALCGLPEDSAEVPAYEHWRQRIQCQFHNLIP